MHSYLQKYPSLVLAIRKLEHLNADQFEIYFERRISTKIDAKNQEIDALSRAEDVGLSIRIIKDHRPGFSFTTSLEENAILQAVETANEIASVMPADEYAGFHSLGSSVYPTVDNMDLRGLSIPLSQKLELAKRLESVCKQADSRITTVRSAILSECSTEIHLVDSQGEHVHHQSSGFTASITCKAEFHGDSQVGSDFTFSNYLDNLEIDTIAKYAAQWAIENLGAEKAPTMKCPAILRNSVVADLLDFLLASFSAEEIDKGRSMLAGKIGQPIFSDQVTLIDDGLFPGGAGTLPFDGEGVPSQKTKLVDAGFLVGILFDQYYARKFQKEPTGNSLRSIKSPPSIGCTNLYMQKGKKNFDDLLNGISKGILITDLMGLHTANPVTGDFSLGASGILIEKGKLTRPVRGFAIAGNVLELFRRMVDISNDIRFFGRIGAPSVRLTEISVGGQ